MTQPNSALSALTPNLQLAWDSTSLGELKLCPKKYQLRILEGWQPIAFSIHLTFGLVYHGALERYHHAKTQGKPFEEALRLAVRYALCATWDKELKRAWMSGDSTKNRGTLIRTIVWYLDHFKDDPVETVILANGKPAVELSFRFPLSFASPGGEPYLLCGHLDRIGKLGTGTYILDPKTTKNTLSEDYFKRYSPDNQFSTYTFAGKVAFQIPLDGLIVDAAQIAVGFSRFQRQPVARTPSEIDEWVGDLQYWLRTAEFYAKQNHWPMNDKACHMYGGCDFRNVCNKPPGAREQWLKAGFVRRVWDPLQIRGDI